MKQALRIVLALFMIGAGLMHFFASAGFVRIVPSVLPQPLLIVYVSGVCEILGGAGLLVPRTQRFSAWGLVALYVAVFPANVKMALDAIPFFDGAPEWLNWARLPLQPVLIAAAWWFTRPTEARSSARV